MLERQEVGGKMWQEVFFWIKFKEVEKLMKSNV